MFIFFASSCDRVPQNDVEYDSDSNGGETPQTEMPSPDSQTWENYVFDQMERDKPYQLYYFRQSETSDGYVLRDIVFNPEYDGEIVIDIPAQDMDGGYLKEIEVLCCFGEVPALILASDFEKHILEPLESALRENKISSLQYAEFVSSYLKVSLSDQKSESGKENLIQLYPICQYADIYRLHTTQPAVLWRCLSAIGYTQKDCFADYAHLDYVSKQNGVQTILNFGVCKPVQAIIIPNTVSKIHSQAFLSFSETTMIYYRGEKKDWNAGWAEDFSNFYYYSETCPTEQGLFWREVDGVPTPWDLIE